MGGTVQTDIDPRSLIGRKAFDRDGTKIGTVDEVYLDDATGEPEWAAVRTGLFSRDAFVPLAPSELVDDVLRVPYERALIKEAPDFGVGRHLSPEQELQLYHHYGLDLPSDAERREEPPPDQDFGQVAGQGDE
ncbi:PRC-barrel domain-containing protein [Streptomyces durbertensis]|uniref:PRC-barrel domain-containing protein n=1 Tax=Streptomyces durbertensis TaxID=2448886 RepID=A0ABR6EC49_9ACTN|nr:PRC-barrel domain-containing protein [Streptomyces durbertensis]MBB1242550.1 PRC-barrel domain-containing protein [Streptomyces durbertensis]